MSSMLTTVVNKYSTVTLISLWETTPLLFFSIQVHGFLSLIDGFTKLSTTLNGYCLQLHNKCLAMNLSLCSMARFFISYVAWMHCYAVFNIFHLAFLG